LDPLACRAEKKKPKKTRSRRTREEATYGGQNASGDVTGKGGGGGNHLKVLGNRERESLPEEGGTGVCIRNLQGESTDEIRQK